jgi:hypothetical protein
MKTEHHNLRIGECVNVIRFNQFSKTYYRYNRGWITKILPGEDMYRVRFVDDFKEEEWSEDFYVDPNAQTDKLQDYLDKLNMHVSPRIVPMSKRLE